MAPILYLVAGVVIGLVAGWLLRGTRNAAKQPAESTAPVARSTPRHAAVPAAKPTSRQAADANPATPQPEPAATDTEPVAEVDGPADEKPEPIAEPAPIPVAEPVNEPAPIPAPEPVNEPAPIRAPEPVKAATPVAFAEPVEVAGPVNGVEPATAPVPAPASLSEPAPVAPTPEPPAAVPDIEEAAEISPAAAPVAVAVTEPDDLTKIAGIGPKMAMALAAAGITTFRQLADTDVAVLRTAVTSAGLRAAPSLATWPEKAKHLAG